MVLNNMKVAVLTADDGVERVELISPRQALEEAGAQVTHLSIGGGDIRTFDQTDPSEWLRADARVAEQDPREFDALVLPGGYINPDLLRRDDDAVSFTRSFFERGKPVGVICHGPWTLIDADVVSGRTLTAVESLKADIDNAGGRWVDEPVHVDRNATNLLVSGRNHEVVEQFAQTLVREFAAQAPSS